jgi:hypothetical protein
MKSICSKGRIPAGLAATRKRLVGCLGEPRRHVDPEPECLERFVVRSKLMSELQSKAARELRKAQSPCLGSTPPQIPSLRCACGRLIDNDIGALRPLIFIALLRDLDGSGGGHSLDRRSSKLQQQRAAELISRWHARDESGPC